MRRNILASSLLVTVAIVVGLVLGSPGSAEDINPMVNGRVKKIDKETSTITLSKDNKTKEVIYTESTEFKMGSSSKNEPSSIDEVEVDHYMGCKGAFKGEQLVASICTFREGEHE